MTDKLPGITSPKGFEAAGVHCGIKADPKKPDLTLIVCETAASAAAVFTQNKMCAAPVIVSRTHLKESGGKMFAVVANSGNANAATGNQGFVDALTMAEEAAEEIGAEQNQVLVCSTGMIGIPMPMDKLRAGIEAAGAALSAGPEADLAAARGIMTTDAAPKMFGVRGEVGGKEVTVAGICKGAGMIAPNMATMLCFITTDAAVSPKRLQACLAEAVDKSFNTIRVDGHTSTNDTVLCLASGLAGNDEIKKKDDPGLEAFQELLDRVTLELALKIVRDGEGADKLCEISVEGAESDKEARAIAVSLADSPLWKCALTAGHPNWGRIVCAVGNVVSEGGPDDLTVRLGGHKVFAKGKPVEVAKGALATAMKEDPIRVHIKLNHGDGTALIRTCDINHKYITENTGAST